MKENKGITLVALVVTIIVLIILAGISISLLLGDNGIIQKAQAGGEKYKEAAIKEHLQLLAADVFADKLGRPTWADYRAALTNDADYDYVVSLTSTARISGEFPTIPEGTTEIFVKVENTSFEFRISANGTVTNSKENYTSTTTIPTESTSESTSVTSPETSPETTPGI